MKHLAAILFLVNAQLLFAAPPTTAPAQDDLAWLLSQGKPKTTQPAAPASQPFSPAAGDDRGARKATLVMSSGEKIHGQFCTTREKPVRVWNETDKEYRDIPYNLIQSMEAKILWERDQPEWHFKDTGSDIKEYSGHTYPARELQYTVTLINGQTVTGGIVAPLYLLTKSDDVVFLLNKRQKGAVDAKLKSLEYIKQVIFE